MVKETKFYEVLGVCTPPAKHYFDGAMELT